ncbi:copper resistance protein NlpE N-terminal domain-containing protein, partial [Klebsiella pneumoniae]|uniref:copper resistance protein NlpE N-terminal domain-containing protein n=1 Tax=Klebsiella pneumoniae TaxID=573 RepID=UPI001D0E8566
MSPDDVSGLNITFSAEVDTLSPAQAAELKPMPQSWRGVLPCADCEGIETSLFLEKDGTWVMNERYL